MTTNIEIKRVSLDMPKHILDNIDKICKDSFSTRRKWFIDAALDKLEKEDLNKINMIVTKTKG